MVQQIIACGSMNGTAPLDDHDAQIENLNSELTCASEAFHAIKQDNVNLQSLVAIVRQLAEKDGNQLIVGVIDLALSPPPSPTVLPFSRSPRP